LTGESNIKTNNDMGRFIQSLFLRFGIAAIILIVLLIYSGCGYLIRRETRFIVEIDTIKERHERLIENSPQYYDSTFTFAVILDHFACGGNLEETEYWPLWQEYMLNHGYDFVFITSHSDSSDLVYAVALENMTAPVLVLPGCEERVSDLWFHQSMILKLIYNSETGTYYYTQTWIVDSTANIKFMTFLDSLVCANDID
jgi:hypothetical protein